jgi:hypothetical protein
MIGGPSLFLGCQVIGLVKFDSKLEEFNLSGVTELKNVRDRYFKFKRGGRWNRVEIANVDRYRRSTYKTLENLVKSFFNKVNRGTRKVPCIVKDDRGQRYVTRFLFEDKETLIATELLPKFLKRYPMIEKFSIAAFYTGNRKMTYEYYDTEKSKSSDQLFFDLRLLHTQILMNRLNTSQSQELINRFYSDIFIKERQDELIKPLHEKEEGLEETIETTFSEKVSEKLEIPPKLEPKLVDLNEKEPIIRFEREEDTSARAALGQLESEIEEKVTPNIEQVEYEIKQYKGSVDFERNFMLKAAEWRLQETLGRVTQEERRNQLVITFYRLMKGYIEPREFYEKTKMKSIY